MRVKSPKRVLSVFPAVILDEAEAAWRPLEFIEPHDDSLDVAHLPEQLVQLFLGRVKAHVPDVQSCRLTK